jgi:hypothetical protein
VKKAGSRGLFEKMQKPQAEAQKGIVTFVRICQQA